MVEELTRRWRKIHKEELYHWYFSFKYNYHGQIKENEGGMAHNMHGGDKKCTQTSDDNLV
jgi:hypothetical protein